MGNPRLFLVYNEADLTDLIETIDFNGVPSFDSPPAWAESHDRATRQDQFFYLFVARLADDCDYEIWVEALDIWIRRIVTIEQLPALVYRRLRRSRRYAALTEHEVSVRLMRMRATIQGTDV